MSFEDLCSKVFAELDAKLPAHLLYHCTDHTRKDVLPMAERLGKEQGISEAELRLLKVAALFHDTGYLDVYPKNEPFGVKRAQEELPKWGYSPEEIEHISRIIMATMMPQNPGDDILCKLMCDADLGHLGTEWFFLRSESLRIEFTKQGILKPETTPRDWNESNLKFLESHSYWSDAGKRILGPGKEKNIIQSKQLLGLS
eukprot:ANDGO_06705.mRNA.1 hypothetical protein